MPTHRLEALLPGCRLILIAVAAVAAALLVQRDGGAISKSHGRLADIELQQAAQRAAMCSGANVAGVGLRGEYYVNEHWRGSPMLVRTDGSIDFDESLDWPAGERADRPRSVRWTGWVKPPITGRYRFHAETPGARVLVSTQVLTGAGVERDIELAAGRFYPITIELSQVKTSPDGGRVRLEWTAPHGARFVVPRAMLYMPTESVRNERT